MMISLWVVLLVFLEYSCIGRLTCSNGDKSVSLYRRWPPDTQPRYGYSVFPIRRHSNELLVPDRWIAKPVNHRQPYIDYKAIYGLRYNPVKAGNRTKTYPANITKTFLNLPQKLLGGLWTLSHHKPSTGLLTNMFNIASSSKIPCIPGNGSKVIGLTGVCLNEQECHKQRGTAMDLCSPGYGVCCVCKLSFLCLLSGICS
uniref:Putative secreted protein n=1 Tax=Anopheles marajoara TaxID=58244 RepID=A0A2M4C5R1_9DIPT